MKELVTQSPADIYIASTKTLRESTESISRFIQNHPKNLLVLNELNSKREEAYRDWTNAANLLKNLPAIEMAVVLNRIEYELNI